MAATSITMRLSIGDLQLCPLPEDGSRYHVVVAAKARIEMNITTRRGVRQIIVQTASLTAALCSCRRHRVKSGIA